MKVHIWASQVPDLYRKFWWLGADINRLPEAERVRVKAGGLHRNLA